MISRAAFRALRVRPAFPAPRTAPLASSPQWTRSYAKNNQRTPPPADPSKSDAPVNPGEQPEFDAAAAPERNTAPETDAPADAPQEPQEPQKPLPDLRQGIPSTFGDEFAPPKHEHNPNNITEDPDKEPLPGGGHGHETGQLPKSAYETSTDRRRNMMASWGFMSFGVMGALGALYLGRDWDSEEEARAHPDAPSGWTPGAIYGRAVARINGQMGYYTEPTFPKLLPDMDPAPPLTLVLSLEDLLVHSEWSRRDGWRTAKRPGVDYFLRYLSQYYELVIFTSLRSSDADPVIRKLDPFRIVMWPLFREATRYEKGEYIKDLSCLNRDLSKTIIIDTDPSHVKLQPENAIILPKWTGQPRDKGLVSLIPFLEYLAMMGTPDVRAALKSFEGKDIATEFALREARAREEFQKELAEKQSQRKKPKFSAGGALMKSLGLNKMAQQGGGLSLGEGQSVSEGLEQGKMLSDQFRERGQKQYEAMEKEIRENGEKWLKDMAEEEKRFMEEQMKSMKSGVFGFLGGAGQKGDGGGGQGRMETEMEVKGEEKK